RLGRRQTEIDAAAGRTGHRCNLHAVPIEIKACLNEKPAKAHLDPGRRSDVAPLHHIEFTAPAREVFVHDQKPAHALGLRAEQLDAFPLRKGGKRRMGRSADEVDVTVAQGGIGLIDREDQFEHNIQALLPEESEFNRGNGRKIRIRDHIRHSKFHDAINPISPNHPRSRRAAIHRSMTPPDLNIYLAIWSAFARTSVSTNASMSTGLVRFPVVTSRSRIQASLFMGIAMSGSTADKRLISS